MFDKLICFKHTAVFIVIKSNEFIAVCDFF